MATIKNIERNKLDYILTDIMPVEISELFSYGKFYEFLLERPKEMDAILSEIKRIKAENKRKLFDGDWWAATPLKYCILKGCDGLRQMSLAHPISVLNMYFFIECYQKELLSCLKSNNHFSLRYHRKNTDLYYKRKSNRLTEYFSKIARKVDRAILQQTGAYFKLHKFNSVSSFMNSRLWQQCNFKYRYFAKVDYKYCFDSIYTHSYKWIIEKNTIDSKEANNNNLYIAIDRILQNINGKSSNGLIVGPEFSRMIAEILLQQIDCELRQNLKEKNLQEHEDYRIFRYVDDVFVFANTPITIETIIDTIESTARKYLLHLNERKMVRIETPVVLNCWIEKTRAFADKVAQLFNKKEDLSKPENDDALVKAGYIAVDRLKNEFAILMNDFPQEKRYVVSYILSTLLNKINSKKDGYKLFQDGKTNKAFVLMELAFFVYSFCPCFEHTQKVLSMIVYFDDELAFKDDSKNHGRLLNLIRRYSFIFEKANLNDICNWFIFFYEFKLYLSKESEERLLTRIRDENNPILWANFLIYSQYDTHFFKHTIESVEDEISRNINQMIPLSPFLQREFWYVIVFNNCPYLSTCVKTLLDKKVDEIKRSGNEACDLSVNLVYEFMKSKKQNMFFYWGYFRFSASRQLTYRTYQRTLFKQYNKRLSTVYYGSLDS